jgi:hypothetical protein
MARHFRAARGKVLGGQLATPAEIPARARRWIPRRSFPAARPPFAPDYHPLQPEAPIGIEPFSLRVVKLERALFDVEKMDADAVLGVYLVDALP